MADDVEFDRDAVMISAGAIVEKGAKIGKGTVIGAGATVAIIALSDDDDESFALAPALVPTFAGATVQGSF